MFTEDLSPFFNSSELADMATLNGVAVVGVMESRLSLKAKALWSAPAQPLALTASPMPAMTAPEFAFSIC